jgi:peptide/nickel transport system permease protein
MASFPSLMAPYSPTEINANTILEPPSWKHLMGTDYLGRDVFSRVVYGARTAVVVAILAVSMSLVVGISLSLIAGYYGGVLDRILTFAMDSLYAFPGLVLAILIVVMLGPSLITMSAALAIWYIPTYYRVMRSEILSVKQKTFVEAAIASGAKDRFIILMYILPNTISSIITLATLNVADVIIGTATIGFLGLGVPPPTPDWGSDLSVGYKFMLSGKWWLMTFPGVMAILVALGFNLLGEGLAEILNPEVTEQ